MRISPVPGGTMPVPDGTKAGPPRASSLRAFGGGVPFAIAYDLSTEAGCRAYADRLAREAVAAARYEYATVGAAEGFLSQRYRLKSFIAKLRKNCGVVIRADRLVRLERAWLRAHRDLADNLTTGDLAGDICQSP